MNLAVKRERWSIPPRYIFLDTVAAPRLADCPDGRLIKACHDAWLAEGSYRQLCREYELAELSGSEACCAEMEAVLPSQKARLRTSITKAACLHSKTDFGLTYKGDTLAYLVESFNLESLRELVGLARHYARDVAHRFQGVGQGAPSWTSAYVEGSSDAPLLAALRHCHDCLARRNALAALTDLPPFAPARDDYEDEVAASLDRARLFCPMTEEGIAGLAQLVRMLLCDRGTRHYHMAVAELSRNLASAVRYRVAPVELELDGPSTS